MLVALFCGGRDAGGEDLSGFASTGFAGEELAVHQISGDVIGIAFEQSTKMFVGGCRITAVHTFHGQAVARESVVRLFGNELFKHLATRFPLVGHWVVSYYTGAIGGVQHRGGERLE